MYKKLFYLLLASFLTLNTFAVGYTNQTITNITGATRLNDLYNGNAISGNYNHVGKTYNYHNYIKVPINEFQNLNKISLMCTGQVLSGGLTENLAYVSDSVFISLIEPKIITRNISCNGIYKWEDTEYTSSGTYQKVYSSENSLDSVVNLVLTITQEPTFVDLGLPSGTMWATSNVGAINPEEFGNYYAWGETEPKDAYIWETYKYKVDGQTTAGTEYLLINGHSIQPGESISGTQYDVAHYQMG